MINRVSHDMRNGAEWPPTGRLLSVTADLKAVRRTAVPMIRYLRALPGNAFDGSSIHRQTSM